MNAPVARKIPFIVGGRRQLPTDANHIEIASPTGGRIWTPELDAASVDAALAIDPFLLRDVPLHEIVSFLSNVGKNWKSPEDSRRRVFVRQLVEILGYSEKAAEHEANWIAMILCSHYRIYDAVAAELGSRHILDHWVSREEAEIRAFPRGRVLHVLAGNVPIGGVASIVRALVTKNVCIVKTASSDPITPVALALSFAEVDSSHPLVKALNVLHWRGGAEGPHERKLIEASDVICAWGGEDAMKSISRAAPASAEVVRFGPKRSIAVVAKGANLDKTARAIAHDVSLYDQRACFSVQQVFVEKDLVEELLPKLEAAFGLYANLLPKGLHDFDEKASWSIANLEAMFLGAKVQNGVGQAWSIVVGPPAWIDAHPLGRTLYVHPVESIAEVVKMVGPEVQTVGVAPWSAAASIRDAVGAAGVSRLVEIGLNNVFRIGGSHDAMFPLQRLVRFVSTELPAHEYTKGITVPIDQTKFLEKDEFLRYVP